MAISQYTESATTNVQLSDYQALIARDNAGSRGYAGVDLSSYADGATAPTVVVGSRWDNNGALYNVTGSNEAISGLAGIANDNTVYIYFDVSALEFIASTTAPTFDNEKRGWYNGNDRALFRLYKNSDGDYTRRTFFGADTSKSSPLNAIFDSEVRIGALYDSSIISSSTTVVLSSDSDVGSGLGSYTKTKEIICPFDGILNTYFEIRDVGGGDVVFGQIYVNDIAVGTERSTTSGSFVSFNEDITVFAGDLVQLYTRSSPTTGGRAQNFRLRGSVATPPLLLNLWESICVNI